MKLLTQSTNGERFAVLDSYLKSDLLGLLDDEAVEQTQPSLGDNKSDSSEGSQSARPKKPVKLRDRILAAILPAEASLWKPEEDEDIDGENTRPGTRASPSSIMAQQSTVARLVNAMASIKRGRDYLGDLRLQFFALN